MKLKPIAAIVAATLALSGCVIAINGESESPNRTTASRTSQSQHGADTAKHNDNSGKVFANRYLIEELANGLKVIIIKTDYPDVVSMNIPVSTGSRNEVEEGKTGFAHFFEHMMFKGTPDYPQHKYDEILKNAGVDNRAYTTDDYTNYYTTFSKEHLATMLKLEADRFQHLTYTESQFRTEALTVKGEYLKNSSNPIRKLLEAARGIAFTTHTYRHTTMGFAADIDAMPDQMAYASKFFDRFYKPQNVSIIISGDVDPQQTLALVKQYWGQWQRGNYIADIKTEPKQTKSLYKHVKFDGMPGHWVMLAFHGPAFDPKQKDKPAVDLLSELYFSKTSDVYQHLVVDSQKVSEFVTYMPDRKDPHMLYIATKVDEVKNVPYVREALLKTLAQARSELADEQKLAELKSNLKFQFINGLDSSAAIAGTLARYVHFERDPELINQLYQTTDQITVEDIRAAANRYFVDDNSTTITMSDLAKLDGFDQPMTISSLLSTNKDAQQGQFKVLDKPSSSPLVDVNWLFNTGPAADPEGKKGVAALTALMLSQGGSQSRSYKDIQTAMYPIAGSFNVQVDKEMVSFRGRIHKDNVQTWQSLAMDQLTNPGWREEDFKRLKTQLLNDIKSSLKSSNDEELGKEVLYSKLYQGHVYGNYNGGDISDLEALTLADVKAFYQQQFTQRKLTLGIIGDMPKLVKTKLMAALAKLPVGDESRLTVPPAPKLQGRHVTVIDKNASSTAVSFGFPIDINRADKDWAALWLVRSYFGEHRSSNSHLYQRIRAIRGMNYGDYAYVEYYPRGSTQSKPDANLGRSEQIFQVWLRPLRDNNDAHFATRVAMYELDQLIKNGMTAEDFEATRNFISNFVPQMVASQDRQLGYALDSKFYQTDDFVDYVRKNLASLTLDEVNRVIRENLQTDNIHYVFISGDAKDMQQRLISGQTSPLKYNSEKPQTLLEEDKIIENYPLKLTAKDIEIMPIDAVFQ